MAAGRKASELRIRDDLRQLAAVSEGHQGIILAVHDQHLRQSRMDIVRNCRAAPNFLGSLRTACQASSHMCKISTKAQPCGMTV